jgi:hypothetical protein
MKTLIRTAVVATLLALGAASAGASVPYRTGGVSAEEFAELNRLASNYNLRLVMADSTSGAYLAGVAVTIRSLADGTTVLDKGDAGPKLLAELPAGRYEVTARSTEVRAGAPDTVTRVITVPASGMAQTVLRFDTGATLSAESPAELRLR